MSNLPIKSIVHVEHDPVAVEVIKWNHRKDGIIHHFMEELWADLWYNDSETYDEKLADLISEHGPFDVVTSGAPCQNLSGMNAHRLTEIWVLKMHNTW